MWATHSCEINARRHPAPTITLSENLTQFSCTCTQVHVELTAGGTMKHIHSITLLTQKSKYTEQNLYRV